MVSAASEAKDREKELDGASRKFINSLKGCLEIPAATADLPEKKLRDDEVVLTDEEKEALLETVYAWARPMKMAEINYRIWKRDISTDPMNKPLPTAEEIWMRVQQLGWEENPDFVVDRWLSPILQQLCYYFAQDVRFELHDPSFSLSKGILLHGPIGCGKTKLLELLARVDRRIGFRVYACPEVSVEYRKDGDAALMKYSHSPICFDDLGFEDANAMHFGNRSNPMADILAARYRRNPRPVTHATTNENAESLEQKYGPRVFSRLVEMFNLLSFDEDAPDRRNLPAE